MAMRVRCRAALVLSGLICGPVVTTQVREVDLSPNSRVLQAGSGRAVVSGRVVDADTGAAIVSAEVALELNSLPSDRAPKVFTDARGAFMFDGAGPGTYRVTATKAGFYVRRAQQFISGTPVTIRGGETIDGLELRLMRGGAISGRVVDDFGEPVAQVHVQAMRYHYLAGGNREPGLSGVTDLTDDLGRFRLYGLVPGEYGLVARRTTLRGEGFLPPIAIGPAPVRPSTELLGVPTYYHGTVSPAEAQTVLLPPEGEVSVELPLVNGRLARISGRVITSAGSPASGFRIALRPTNLALISWGAQPLGEGGAFSFTDIPPGDYRIDVVSTTRDASSERAAMPIAVTGDDLDDLTVVTTTGGTVVGRVTFDTTFRRSTFQLTARSAGGLEGSATAAISEPVGADGHVELHGLPSRVYLEPVGGQWAITSVLVDGREMKDEPLDLSGGILQNVSIAVTDRLTVVAGLARDSRDRPLADHVVVLMRADAAAGSPAERSRTLWTGLDGTFQVRGLPVGSYLAAVVEDLEPGFEHSPEFQEAIRARGHRFTLSADAPADLILSLLPAR